MVQEHLETFLAQVQTETGASLPDFVKDEFDAFLECGIPIYARALDGRLCSPQRRPKRFVVKRICVIA